MTIFSKFYGTVADDDIDCKITAEVENFTRIFIFSIINPGNTLIGHKLTPNAKDIHQLKP